MRHVVCAADLALRYSSVDGGEALYNWGAEGALGRYEGEVVAEGPTEAEAAAAACAAGVKRSRYQLWLTRASRVWDDG